MAEPALTSRTLTTPVSPVKPSLYNYSAGPLDPQEKNGTCFAGCGYANCHRIRGLTIIVGAAKTLGNSQKFHILR
jgi:hypothetical protein